MGEPYRFGDGEGHVLKELDEASLQAVNAVGLQVAKKYTCMISKEQGQPNPIGSGTLVKIDSRLFVATAKHLFEDFQADDLIGIYWGKEDNRVGVYRRDIILDEKLDLAAIPLPTDTKACCVPLGYHDRKHSQTESDIFVLSGIPAEKYKINQNSHTLIVGHISLGLIPLPQKDWPKNPEIEISPEVDFLLHYTKGLAINGRGVPMPQIAPWGFSGGGIWSVPSIIGDIWSPDKASLVAIQWGVEQNNWRYLRATRIECWLRLIGK